MQSFSLNFNLLSRASSSCQPLPPARVAMAYLQQPMEKRFKTDINAEMIVQKPMTLVQDELADKYKLAQVKEFSIQGHPNGKVLGCGVEVHLNPSDSRFRIRIYDRDRDNYGKLKSYIEISWNLFQDIKKKEDRIKCFLLPQLRYKQHIFHYNAFSVAVVPPHIMGRDPVVEFIKKNTKIHMNELTFDNMMSYEETLKAEYAECTKRRDEEKLFIDEIVNVMAYIRNGKKTNEYVKEPADWYQAGTITTWKKFTEQVGKSKERLKRRSKLN